MKLPKKEIRGKEQPCGHRGSLRSQLHTFTTLIVAMLICSIPIAVAQQNSIPSAQQDTAPPEIKYFTIFPTTTSTLPAEFSYQAADYGSDGSLEYCSGVKKIEFFDKQTGKIIATRTGERDDCVIEETFEYLPTEEGQQTICAKATDYQNIQSNEECAQLNVIKHAPEIKKIEFFDSQSTLNSVKKDGSLVSIRLFFEDANLIDTESTEINVEKITETKDDLRRSYKAEGNTIIIPDILTAQNFECKIKTKITDIFGNFEQKETACDLTIDDKQPIPLALKTDLQDIENAYVVSKTSTTTITAEFEETGIGFERQKNVYIDLENVAGNARQQADDCQKTAKGWECNWNVAATAPKGGYTITLLADSEDDYGNKITSQIKQDVDVVEGNVQILDVQYAPQFPTEEDEISIMISLNADVAEPKATIDASAITKNKQKINAECDKDGDALRCNAKIKNLQASDEPQEITVIVQDAQGNKKETATKIQVFETEPKTKDYFNFGGAIIQPTNGIDRKTATITEYPIFASLKWNPKETSKDIKIAAQTIQCDQKYLATTPEVTGQDSTRPTLFFKTTTDVSDILEDSIKIPCTANLIIKKGNVVYKKAETKNFALTIPLYNNPLGSVSETIQKKIDETTGQIKSFDERINDWEEINHAIGKLAGIGQTIAQIDAMMAAAADIAWIIAVIIDVFAPGAGDSKWAGFCNPYTYYNIATKVALWSPTYFPILPQQPLKLAAFISSCQMCRHSGSLVIPFSGAIGDITTTIDGQEGKPTQIDPTLLYEWDPKKSIHVAQNCYCPNAIEYNLRKEKQLKCIYKNCIKEHAKKGLPLSNCDQTLKEQTCLYVDSAAWKLAGGAALAKLIQQMIANLLETLPIGVMGAAWGAVCDPLLGYWGITYGTKWAYWEGCRNMANAPFLLACSTWAGIHELVETDFFAGNQFDWDKYDAEIEGNDYCAQED